MWQSDSKHHQHSGALKSWPGLSANTNTAWLFYKYISWTWLGGHFLHIAPFNHISLWTKVIPNLRFTFFNSWQLIDSSLQLWLMVSLPLFHQQTETHKQESKQEVVVTQLYIFRSAPNFQKSPGPRFSQVIVPLLGEGSRPCVMIIWVCGLRLIYGGST